MTLAPSAAVEALGWAAAATFAGSYLARRAGTLVRVQIAGALMWAAYGVLVRSAPIVAANALLVVAAAWKAWTTRARAEGAQRPAAPAPAPATTPRAS